MYDRRPRSTVADEAEVLESPLQRMGFGLEPGRPVLATMPGAQRRE